MELEKAVAQLRSTVRDLNQVIYSLEKLAAANGGREQTKVVKARKKIAGR